MSLMAALWKFLSEIREEQILVGFCLFVFVFCFYFGKSKMNLKK